MNDPDLANGPFVCERRKLTERKMARIFVPFGICLGPLQSLTRLGLTRLS
jgi:hypothetical protein